LAPAGARQLAEGVIANGPLALEVMAREELGIDPDQLGGSPWKAAASSFAMFSVGAVVPLVPFFFASRKPALIASLMLSAIVLLALGAAVTTLTGRSPRRSAIRQLLFGLGAAAITYAIGRAVGGVVG
jgi:VIT1/CCC1 family predicted Fe2+/Mn2+ transporter